jgi:hypothetical protein
MKRLILVASCLLLASPSLAQETSGSQADRTPSSQSGSTAGGTQSEDDRVVCRRLQADTGSMIGSRRVCMTKREWREYERNN